MSEATGTRNINLSSQHLNSSYVTLRAS